LGVEQTQELSVEPVHERVFEFPLVLEPGVDNLVFEPFALVQCVRQGVAGFRVDEVITG